MLLHWVFVRPPLRVHEVSIEHIEASWRRLEPCVAFALIADTSCVPVRNDSAWVIKEDRVESQHGQVTVLFVPAKEHRVPGMEVQVGIGVQRLATRDSDGRSPRLYLGHGDGCVAKSSTQIVAQDSMDQYRTDVLYWRDVMQWPYFVPPHDPSDLQGSQLSLTALG